MGKSKNSEHCTIRNGNLFCTNCGEEHKIGFPINTQMFSAIAKTFAKIHKSCKKKWEPPVADLSLTIKQREDWWLTFGERGISSETIFTTIAGVVMPGLQKGHPCDPDDFNRCYLLLKTIPEWKDKLYLMKQVSPVWERLVDNWQKLTEMLEEQLKTHKPNGMYELMKSLGA